MGAPLIIEFEDDLSIASFCCSASVAGTKLEAKSRWKAGIDETKLFSWVVNANMGSIFFLTLRASRWRWRERSCDFLMCRSGEKTRLPLFGLLLITFTSVKRLRSFSVIKLRRGLWMLLQRHVLREGFILVLKTSLDMDTQVGAPSASMRCGMGLGDRQLIVQRYVEQKYG